MESLFGCFYVPERPRAVLKTETHQSLFGSSTAKFASINRYDDITVREQLETSSLNHKIW